MAEHTIKVHDLLNSLSALPPDSSLMFGSGNLKFLRINKKSETLFQIEFESKPGIRTTYASFDRG